MNKKEKAIYGDNCEPIFCGRCGGRIGWAEDRQRAEECYLYCDECADMEIEGVD